MRHDKGGQLDPKGLSSLFFKRLKPPKHDSDSAAYTNITPQEPYTCITPMMQGTARDVGVVHVPDEALRLAVHMNKQHRRTREEQARQRRENANCVISKPKQEN